jgi:hypothetical protein
MVTTSRLVSLDAVGRDGGDLIHLTGPLQVVARAAMGDLDGPPVEVDLRFDAARVRGVGLKSGARYWVEGLHRSTHQPGNGSAPFDVVGCFDLLGHSADATSLTPLTLAVRFRVAVPPDGRVAVVIEEVRLMRTPTDTSSG